jgi:hypothetical protein
MCLHSERMKEKPDGGYGGDDDNDGKTMASF